jgi:riboflavin transporter FmnP
MISDNLLVEFICVLLTIFCLGLLAPVAVSFVRDIVRYVRTQRRLAGKRGCKL